MAIRGADPSKSGLIPVPHFQKKVGVHVVGGSCIAIRYAPAESWEPVGDKKGFMKMITTLRSIDG